MGVWAHQGALEKALRGCVVADQQILGLLVVFEHHLVVFAAEA